MFRKIFNKNKQSGFTLVELMVSLTIFIAVVLAAVGSLYSVNSSSKKIQSMRGVLDNLSFAVESISRTVRTSNSVVCGGSLNLSSNPNCPFSSQEVNSAILVDSTLGFPQLVEYRLGFYENGSGTIQKRVQEGGVWTNWISLTSKEVNIQHLYFYVEGAEPGDTIQTSVQLFVQGVATIDGNISPFAIQTYLSKRSNE